MPHRIPSYRWISKLAHVCGESLPFSFRPLTVLVDHSRFALGPRACLNQQTDTVQTELTQIFRLYGLREQTTMDHGSPWCDGATSRNTV